MSLSSELIAQFVQITKDDKKTKSETTVYGRAKVEYDGRTYVKFDGSELLTPATTTTDVADGERVTVLIKDHTATITGNLSSPSARTDTVKEVSNNVASLTGQVVTFNNVVANKVDTEQLNATNANVSTLEADVAKLKEATITEAEIKELRAENAEIKETLTAQEAIIEDLEAEVGDIDTLIFGSATGGVIQTSFANAVIAQLGDAQIKSAMIDSMSASKIKSGDIITNNVRVMSEDGSLIISDETMQISDSSRVRVQIGKDASNDYSINIWDANGNLMFSKGGITDSAIKDAIIRNDMVSDTANIAAHKLDIDSLFEEINGSTKTINSTRVYLDEKKQSLDVAFKSMSSDVEEIQNGVTSQATRIEVIQGQIESKVWKQDINTAVSEVEGATETLSTKYTTLEQELDSVSTTVASHTSEISKKADSSTVTTVSDKVASLEADVDGFKTTVSETYATTEETDELNTRMTTVEQTASDLTVQIQNSKKQIYHSASGISGTAGYIGICTIVITDSWMNRPILFELNNRGRQSSNVSLRFENVGNNDPNLDHLQYDGAINVWAYKIAASTWSLIVQKSESYDTVYVKDFCNNNDGVTGEWTNVHYDTLPTTDITAGTLLAGKIPKSEVDDAAKTATNYLNFSSSGLVVGDMTKNTLGKNVLIDSDSVDIRNGDTVLASFGANELILGQNAEDSVINLCDGAGKISAITSGATTSYPHYDGIKMESEAIEMKSSQFRADTTSGTSFVNSGSIKTVNQSSSAGSTTNLKSECKITSSGSRLSAGVLASATSSASTTCTDIFASHYNASSGTTNSNYVSVYPTHTQMSKPITINSVYVTALNKHLWSGANYMNASQSITLSEAVSAQVNGIVLVWSYYESGAAKDFNFHCHFVPKWLVSNYAAKGSDYPLANHTGNVLAHKYLYISDTKITGNDYNDDGNLAGSKATYTNTAFVLRAVIGV